MTKNQFSNLLSGNCIVLNDLQMNNLVAGISRRWIELSKAVAR